MLINFQEAANASQDCMALVNKMLQMQEELDFFTNQVKENWRGRDSEEFLSHIAVIRERIVQSQTKLTQLSNEINSAAQIFMQ